jgi:hypothetical protein
MALTPLSGESGGERLLRRHKPEMPSGLGSAYGYNNRAYGISFRQIKKKAARFQCGVFTSKLQTRAARMSSISGARVLAAEMLLSQSARVNFPERHLFAHEQQRSTRSASL